MKHTQTSQQRKTTMTWTFVRALIRVFIAWAEAHLFTHNNVPQWMKDNLPVFEGLARTFLLLLLLDPAALEDIGVKRDPNQPLPPLDRIEISIAEFRDRLAKLKSIVANPAEETARLKAALEAHNIRLKKIAGLRPITVSVLGNVKLVHACALSRITPQARPPPV